MWVMTKLVSKPSTVMGLKMVYGQGNQNARLLVIQVITLQVKAMKGVTRVLRTVSPRDLMVSDQIRLTVLTITLINGKQNLADERIGKVSAKVNMWYSQTHSRAFPGLTAKRLRHHLKNGIILNTNL